MNIVNNAPLSAEIIHCLSQYQDIKIIETIDFGRCLLLDEQMMLSTVEAHDYK